MPRNYTIPIPPPSQAAFKARDKNKPQNPGLIFDRFPPNWGPDSTLKRDGLETVLEAAGRIDRELFEAWVMRWRQDANIIQADPFVRVSDWRFVAGLGRKGSLETGFTFNRYGFPYLPGSSVKGLARMAALVEVAEILGTDKLNQLEEILVQEKDEKFKEDWQVFTQQEQPSALAVIFRKVFGTTSEAGTAIFLDAIPGSSPRLELDIMNPHYPDYYQGKAPPTNWQSPQPITFLTVAARTPFLFAVGWRREVKLDTDAFDKAVGWLQTGLENLGAGAKTSAGYGYFVEQTGETGAPNVVRPIAPVPAGYKAGTVVSFGLGPNRSFGYITPDGGGADIFVHKNGLSAGLSTLQPGQRVIYKLVSSRQGVQAQDVKLQN